MKIVPLPEQKLTKALILFAGSQLVRMTVALAFWQVTTSGRLSRSIAAFALKAVSLLAEMLGHLVEARFGVAPETPRAFEFTVVSEILPEKGANILQRHHSSI